MRNVTLAGALGGFLPLTIAAYVFDWGLGGIWAGLLAFVVIRTAGGVHRTLGGRWAVVGVPRRAPRRSGTVRPQSQPGPRRVADARDTRRALSARHCNMVAVRVPGTDPTARGERRPTQRLRSAAYQWTEVITCHLRRPPVASALAAVHGIRRGLHAAPPAPAHAFGQRCAACCAFDLRSAPGRAPAGAMRKVGASVPCPRGRRGGVQLLRRSHLSQALKRLIFYPT